MRDEVLRQLHERYGDHPDVLLTSRAAVRAAQVVLLSHRWQGRAVLIVVSGRQPRPRLVVKVDRDVRHQSRLEREAAALRQLERYDDLTGLVPRPVGPLALPGAMGFVQTAVPGQPLTAVLRRRGGYRARPADRDHARVRAWFERLASHEPRGEDAVVDLAELDDELPAILDDASRGLPWIHAVRREARAAGRVAVPRVLVHGDVGPSNLLLHRGAMRLVDWESELVPRPPLGAALTFVNHYVRATPLPDGRLPTRDEAIERTFLGEDGLTRLSRRTWGELLTDRGIAPELAPLLAVRALTDLATGSSETAHERRGRRMWRLLLQHLACVASERPGAWPSSQRWP